MNLALIHAKVVEQIIQFVGEYYEVHQVGCSGRALSIRYARRLKELGGFQQTMHELVKCGAIQATMKRSGAYLYFPQNVQVNESEGKPVLTG